MVSLPSHILYQELNGINWCPNQSLLLEVNRSDATYAPDFGKFKTGKIALQDHSTDVKFRNIKIREL